LDTGRLAWKFRPPAEGELPTASGCSSIGAVSTSRNAELLIGSIDMAQFLFGSWYICAATKPPR
jgi:hypothetical protein